MQRLSFSNEQETVEVIYAQSPDDAKVATVTYRLLAGKTAADFQAECGNREIPACWAQILDRARGWLMVIEAATAPPRDALTTHGWLSQEMRSAGAGKYGARPNGGRRRRSPPPCLAVADS